MGGGEFFMASNVFTKNLCPLTSEPQVQQLHEAGSGNRTKGARRHWPAQEVCSAGRCCGVRRPEGGGPHLGDGV